MTFSKARTWLKYSAVDWLTICDPVQPIQWSLHCKFDRSYFFYQTYANRSTKSLKDAQMASLWTWQQIILHLHAPWTYCLPPVCHQQHEVEFLRDFRMLPDHLTVAMIASSDIWLFFVCLSALKQGQVAAAAAQVEKQKLMAEKNATLAKAFPNSAQLSNKKQDTSKPHLTPSQVRRSALHFPWYMCVPFMVG